MKPSAGPGATGRRRAPRLPFLFFAVSFVLLAALSRGAVAQPLGLMLEGAYMPERPTGNIQLTGLSTSAGTATTSIDLESDLALGKRSIIPFGARFLTKRFRVEGEYLQSTFSGDAILSRDIVYQNVIYRVGDHVGTTLKFRDISGHVRFDLLSGNYAGLGIGADIDVIRETGTLEAPSRGLSASDERTITVPTPTIGVSFHDASRVFWFDAKFGYIKYQGSKAEKWRVESGYKLTQEIGVKAGWRWLSGLWLKERAPAPDDRIDIKLQGYYAGVFLNF